MRFSSSFPPFSYWETLFQIPEPAAQPPPQPSTQTPSRKTTSSTSSVKLRKPPRQYQWPKPGARFQVAFWPPPCLIWREKSNPLSVTSFYLWSIFFLFFGLKVMVFWLSLFCTHHSSILLLRKLNATSTVCINGWFVGCCLLGIHINLSLNEIEWNLGWARAIMKSSGIDFIKCNRLVDFYNWTW